VKRTAIGSLITAGALTAGLMWWAWARDPGPSQPAQAAVASPQVAVASPQIAIASPQVAAPPAPVAAPRSRAVAVGASFVVIPPSARYVRALDAAERREQIRDWAVFGTLARVGPTAIEATSNTTVAAVRLPALADAGALDYGRGRLVYTDQRLLLFHDRDDPDPRVTLAHLADRVRSERGDLPPVIEVYGIEELRDDGKIRVVRLADVTRDALLSSEYGYVEGEGTTEAMLTDWLARADDLTYADLTDGRRLVLGGRRFASARTSGLALEDIAVLYQEQPCRAPKTFGGTGVGMTSQYTAAVARAWASDKGRSAPVFEVPGFPIPYHRDGDLRGSMRIKLDLRARIALNHGRIALPPWDVEISARRDALAPDDSIVRTVRWWNRHFEDVADYEQEYHRLNQIMKWVSVTAALRPGPTAGYLGHVPVARGLRFASWRAQHRARLRYVDAPQAPQHVADGPCFPLVASSDLASGRQAGAAIGAGVQARRRQLARGPAEGGARAKPRDMSREAKDHERAQPNERSIDALVRHDPTATGKVAKALKGAADPPAQGHGLDGTETALEHAALGQWRVTYQRSAVDGRLSAALVLGTDALGTLGATVTTAGVELSWRGARSSSTADATPEAVVPPSRDSRAALTRDIDTVLISRLRTFRPTDRPREVYIEDRMLISREGLEADPGVIVSRARRRPHVKIEVAEIDGSAGRPDRIKDQSRRIEFVRAATGDRGDYQRAVAVFLSACGPSHKAAQHDECR